MAAPVRVAVVLAEGDHEDIPQLCLQGYRGRPDKDRGMNSSHQEEARTFVFSAIPLASLSVADIPGCNERDSLLASPSACTTALHVVKGAREGILQLQNQMCCTGGKAGIRNRKIHFAWTIGMP